MAELGARAEYRFEPQPARNGTEAHAQSDQELERYLHLHALNRGLMLTPFHNMALMAPTTTEEDVDRHTEAACDGAGRTARVTPCSARCWGLSTARRGILGAHASGSRPCRPRSGRPLRAARDARRGRLRARLPGNRPTPGTGRRGQGDQALVGRGQRMGGALPAGGTAAGQRQRSGGRSDLRHRPCRGGALLRRRAGRGRKPGRPPEARPDSPPRKLAASPSGSRMPWGAPTGRGSSTAT